VNLLRINCVSVADGGGRAGGEPVTRKVWAFVRLAGGTAIAAVIVMRLGAGPFLTGLRSVSTGPLALACAIAMVTTTCCAWRWWLVARGLGVPLRLGTAIAAYYRSQFLNGALPGGVLGDVHRGVRHGREAGDLGRGLRAVLWERSAGQVVQVCVTVAVLATFPSPVRQVLRISLPVLALSVLAAVLVVPVLIRHGSSRWARARHTAASDLRAGVAAPSVWPGVVGCSVLSLAGHVATFLIAARAAGSTVPADRLLPLAMLVLSAAAVPTNVGGWGPREGVAAWAFSAAGLGGAQGVAAGIAYGVLVTAASLPGAVILFAGWTVRRPGGAKAAPRTSVAPRRRRPAAVGAAGGVLDG
jgi:uncharacterized membrane protein YbhN (UPF0104 family)